MGGGVCLNVILIIRADADGETVITDFAKRDIIRLPYITILYFYIIINILYKYTIYQKQNELGISVRAT